MRKLEDLIDSRVLSSGVFEYNSTGRPTIRGKILYIQLCGGKVKFTLVEMIRFVNNTWVNVEDNSGVGSFSFNKETVLLGHERPQFDFNGGWVIIYPNTDSVRIA